MSVNNTILRTNLDATGQVISYRLQQPYSLYLLTGGNGDNLTGGIDVELNGADTPYKGLTFNIIYQGNVVYSGGNVVTIFGQTLTASQAQKHLVITAVYTTSWNVTIEESPKNQVVYVEVDSAGGTYNCDFDSLFNYYFYGSGTLASSYSITSSVGLTPATRELNITWAAEFELGGNEVTILGEKLTEQQANGGNTTVIGTYDTVASAWKATIVETSNVIRKNQGVNTYDWTTGAQTFSLNPNVDKYYQQFTGAGTLDGNISYTSTGTYRDGEGFSVKYSATLSANGYSVNIFGVALTDDEILNGNLTVIAVWDASNSAFVTQKILGDGFGDGEKELVAIQASFEADEVGVVQFTAPYNCKLTNIEYCVNKTLAGTDDGVIAITIAGNSTSPANITIPMSSGVGAVASTAITSINSVTFGDSVALTTSKTTAGGRAILFLTLVRTA